MKVDDGSVVGMGVEEGISLRGWEGIEDLGYEFGSELEVEEEGIAVGGKRVSVRDIGILVALSRRACVDCCSGER